jgi:Peptidase MA superfamily
MRPPALLAALLLARAALADPPSPRAQIESTLADMSRAVVAADGPGFLAHIAADDPTLLTEWRHWADQLDTARPTEFSLEIGEGPATFDDARAEFPLVMAWLSSTGPKESWGSGGTARRVTFPPVVFTRDDPDGDGPLPARWLFRGERWERRDCDGFAILYIPGNEKVVHEVFQAFPVARDHDADGFGVKPPPQVLKLFTSMDHLKATVYLNMPDQVLGGWNEHGESIKFLTTYTGGVEGWTNAYAHEFGHVCTWELGPMPARLPWWAEEGVAELAAEAYRPGYWDRLDRSMRKDAEAGALTPWSDLSDYITTAASLKRRAYTQGNHMVRYISGRCGRDGRNAWLRAMAAGKTLDEATRAALGIPFEELDKGWRESLAKPAAEAANNPGGF